MREKIQILSTKLLDQTMIELADQNGIQIHQASFIETKCILTQEQEKSIFQLLQSPHNIIITSNKAANILASILNKITTEHNYYVVGSSTAATIKKLGKNHFISYTANHAIELGTYIFQQHADKKFIYFSGDIRREELPNLLNQHKVLWQEIPVYTTQLTPHKLTNAFDGILFFSPSGVNSYFTYHSPKPFQTYFSIGSTTTQSIENYTIENIVTISTPSTELLIQKIIQYYNQKNEQQ